MICRVSSISAAKFRPPNDHGELGSLRPPGSTPPLAPSAFMGGELCAKPPACGNSGNLNMQGFGWGWAGGAFVVRWYGLCPPCWEGNVDPILINQPVWIPRKVVLAPPKVV